MAKGRRKKRNVPVTRCEDLEPRHREILQLLATNHSRREIAKELNLSIHTINHYLSKDHDISIFPVIGVDNPTDAILWYVRHCLEAQQQPTLQEQQPPVQIQEEVYLEQEPHFFSFFRGFLTAIFVGVILFIFVPLFRDENVKSFPYYYSNIFALIPAIAGSYGLWQHWHLTNNNGFRRITWWFSVGLILWAVGQVLWVWWIYYYGDDVPYPSAADIGYVTSALSLVIGLYILRREIARDANPKQYIAWIVPSILLTTSLVFVFWAREGRTDLEGDPRKLILDIAYPTVDLVALGMLISIIVAPSFQWLDSQIRWMVYITTIGIVILYIADTSFSVTTSLPEEHRWAFYNGSPPDVVFTTAFWILGLALTLIPNWYRSKAAEA